MPITLVDMRTRRVCVEPSTKLTVFPGYTVQVEGMNQVTRRPLGKTKTTVERVELNRRVECEDIAPGVMLPRWQIVTSDGRIFTCANNKPIAHDYNHNKFVITETVKKSDLLLDPGTSVWVVEGKKPFVLKALIPTLRMLYSILRQEGQTAYFKAFFSILSSLVKLNISAYEVISPTGTAPNSLVYVKDPSGVVYSLASEQLFPSKEVLLEALPGAIWGTRVGFTTSYQLDAAYMPLPRLPAPEDDVVIREDHALPPATPV